LAYSKWYHQYPRFPLQALKAASVLNEYTLTDRGIWLSSAQEVTSKLKIFAQGGDVDPNDPLLNPAHVLLGSKAKSEDQVIWEKFMTWVVDHDGFKKPSGSGKEEQLYSE
jgi:ABC-type tungstate transport system permease subunit